MIVVVIFTGTAIVTGVAVTGRFFKLAIPKFFNLDNLFLAETHPLISLVVLDPLFFSHFVFFKIAIA